MMRTCAILGFVASSAAGSADPDWDAFKAKYKKHYKDDDDESARHDLFTASKVRVEKLNKLNGQPAFGINWMSDRYESEKYKMGLIQPEDFVPTAPVADFIPTMRAPSGIDWRNTNVVTPVKNQGQCGSCWAVAAVEAIESQMILTTGDYDFTLSPQQVTSCAPDTGSYPCSGCRGGFAEGAYEYVKSAPGLANSFFIPYEQSMTDRHQRTEACPTDKVDAITGEYEQLQGNYAQLSGYSYAVKPCTSGPCKNQNLQGLAAALETTPLAVCVNADVWNDYHGGVLTAAACGSMGADSLNHCVMAVGFNATAPTPYWIVRNSWATTWGEEGYIRLEMAKNTCGLANDATIPHVNVHLSESDAAKAAMLREEKYKLATKGAESLTVVV